MTAGPSSADPAARAAEARARAVFEAMPMMRTLGAELVAVGEGTATVAMPADPRFAQQNGYAHAGTLATLGDTAGGIAALTLMPAGSDVLAVEFKINYLAPGTGDRLEARAKTIRQGRTIGVVEVSVHGIGASGETLCARMQQTVMRIDPR